MKKKVFSALSVVLVLVLLCAVLSSCAATQQQEGSVPVKYMGSNIRVAATSAATCEILDALDYDNVVGVPKAVTTPLPERYKHATDLGSPMIPNAEVLKSIKPDLVLSPMSLHEQLLKEYQNLNLNAYFLNLSSPQGMFESIEDLGKILGREKQADKLSSGYKDYIKSVQKKHKKDKAPTVLILMGFPGNFMACTDESYTGSLCKILGAKNIYTGKGNASFVQVNTEDMLLKDPDIILRTSHAAPEATKKMYDKEFATNDVWKHFRAVKNGRVYDMPHDLFGMSAKLNYKQALQYLEKILYPAG